MKIRKHELLMDAEKSVICCNVTVNKNNLSTFAEIGYLYIQKIKTEKVCLDSGTGYRYEVLIPEDYLSIDEGSQYNTQLQIIAEID